MSTIYIILGIVGWAAAAIVVPLYLWRPPSRRGFETHPSAESRP